MIRWRCRSAELCHSIGGIVVVCRRALLVLLARLLLCLHKTWIGLHCPRSCSGTRRINGHSRCRGIDVILGNIKGLGILLQAQLLRQRIVWVVVRLENRDGR